MKLANRFVFFIIFKKNILSRPFCWKREFFCKICVLCGFAEIRRELFHRNLPENLRDRQIKLVLCQPVLSGKFPPPGSGVFRNAGMELLLDGKTHLRWGAANIPHCFCNRNAQCLSVFKFNWCKKGYEVGRTFHFSAFILSFIREGSSGNQAVRRWGARFRMKMNWSIRMI